MTNEQKYINEMIEQFNNMDKLPIIEYEYETDEYDIFELFTTPYGIQVKYEDILIEWDYIFTLDEHLQAVYEEIVSRYN